MTISLRTLLARTRGKAKVKGHILGEWVKNGNTSAGAGCVNCHMGVVVMTGAIGSALTNNCPKPTRCDTCNEITHPGVLAKYGGRCDYCSGLSYRTGHRPYEDTDSQVWQTQLRNDETIIRPYRHYSGLLEEDE